MKSLGQDVCHLSRGRNLDQQHLTILDDFVGEVLLSVDVFGAFPSPLDARGAVFVYQGRFLLRETKTVQKRQEIQDLTDSH